MDTCVLVGGFIAALVIFFVAKFLLFSEGINSEKGGRGKDRRE